MLRVSGLGCRRDGRLLFDALSFELAAGECLELRGANGSGKSTLLRCVAGLFEDFEGTIDAVPSLYSGHKLGLSPLLSAEENLSWFAGLAGLSPDVPAVLAAVGMPGYAQVLCRNLSAGQQRRVALARMLVGGRSLWLLDEPLTALDADGQELVRRLLRDHVAQGGAAVCATHQPLQLDGVRVLELGAGAT